MRRLLIALMLVMGLAACDSAPEPGGDGGAPALWQIANDRGEVEGWLFGSIHALPDGTHWRSELLEKTITDADLLVVEVAALKDQEKLSRLFGQMAFDHPPALPLLKRIEPARHKQFEILLTAAKVRRSYFDKMESWAAALTLAQVAQQAKAENGVDLALIDAFEGREVTELEGAAKQLAIFNALPEKEQRDLLDAVIEESAAYDEDVGRLARIWRTGDLAALEAQTSKGILADPELYEALLASRNRRWAAQIENLLSAAARPLIAVGAGHVVGKDGLPALLKTRGYIVTRIQ